MKLTKLEKQWILYDVGNSAFILIVSTIIPIYFNYLTELANLSQTQYLAYWGYAASISTLIVALLGPIMGTITDRKNYKKPIFLVFIVIGTLGCALLGFCSQWLLFLIIFILTKVSYSISLIFYDSMLTDVSTIERMDMVSSQGFAWGYIGSCIPFVLSLIFVLGYEALKISFHTAIIIAFLLIALWWLFFSLPLLKKYKQVYFSNQKSSLLTDSFGKLWNTLKHIRQEKHVFFFLISFFFYIDGVYTIMEMATSYGKSLGLTSSSLLLALLTTQIVAFPCSIIFGYLSQRFLTEKLITLCITAYLLIALFSLQLNSQLEFWFLAICVGMFQGGIQSLSRSYFAKIIPPEKSGEYFGILDIFGKGASFLGTMLVSTTTQLSGSTSLGVGSLVVIFVIGLFFFQKAAHIKSHEKLS